MKHVRTHTGERVSCVCVCVCLCSTLATVARADMQLVKSGGWMTSHCVVWNWCISYLSVYKLAYTNRIDY